METLAYLHLALASETPAEINQRELLNWRKFSSQAWMYLLPVIVVLSSLGMASQTFAQVLKQGSSGSEVRAVQERLYELRLLNQSPSGKFGSATRDAVIRFQRSQGLNADGIVGSQTKNALFGYARQIEYDASSSLPALPTRSLEFPSQVQAQGLGDLTETQVLQRGDRGFQVEELQQRLSDQGFDPGPIDGVFGSQTQRAVRQFQREKGIYPDGVAGSETLAQLGLGSNSPTPRNPYVVVVPIRDNDTLAQVRRYIPGAVTANSRRGDYVNAGEFPDRGAAESLSHLLRSQGLDARVTYFH